jgi:hypothetical protein
MKEQRRKGKGGNKKNAIDAHSVVDKLIQG